MNPVIKGWFSLLAFSAIFSLTAQNGSLVQLQVSSAIAQPGETVCLNVTGAGMNTILAMQFSVRWDPAVLEYVEVKNFNLPGQSLNDFGFRFITEGAVTFLYLAPPTANLPKELSLFTLCLRAKGSGGSSSSVEISETPTNVEFVGIIGGTEDIIKSYSAVGGSVIIPGAQTPAAPFTLSAEKTAPTYCVSGAPVALRVQPSGGLPPYQFSWSGPHNFSGTGAEIAAARPGQYAVTATDGGGARLQAYFQVDTSRIRITKATLSDAACAGTKNGSIALTVGGGAGAYSYRWSNGAAGATLANLSAGSYSVTITDETGCSLTAAYDLTAGPGITLAPEVTAPSCGQPNGVIRLNAGSPAGGLTYAWQGGAAAAERSGLAPGTYAVTVSDAAGCKTSRGFSFSWQPIEVAIDSRCTTNPDSSVTYTAAAMASGGRAPYGIRWSTGQQQADVTLPGAGDYSLTVTDADGCTQEKHFSIAACPEGAPIWPGDANNDGRVDHRDLLNIGLGFGLSGPPRQSGPVDWQAQPGANWVTATPVSAVNFKFADTDGNGRIEAADTAAISTYWGRTSAPGFQPSVTPRNDGVALFLAAAPATLGQTNVFDIMLGEAAQPAGGVYGLAFRMEYDSLVVRSGSVRLAVDQSWLGDGLLTLYRNFSQAHYLDAALTLTDHQGRDGSGAIAQLILDLEAELPNGADRYELPIRITQVRLINAGEEELAVDARPTTLVLERATAVNDPLLQAEIRLFPNPASDYLRLETGALRPERLELIDAAGRRVRAWPGAERNLDVRLLSAGLYWLRVIAREGVVVKAVRIGR